ncbi:hypothetical protein E8E13_002360 [Curvularia kusanoi]|uniref:Uncharacterized protein n=1 Tax=Curvularia kusanoi TaxID=90978 RepID=A0A9P4T4A2_CURKU|nr:hypothetical protein E8E13_002360 [Curvularia kusanoi]
MAELIYSDLLIQQSSIHILCTKYGLQSDMSHAPIDEEHSADFRYHWEIALGIEPHLRQALIQDFEVLRATNGGYALAADMLYPQQALGTLLGSPRLPVNIPAPAPTAVGYPIIRCPGDRYDGQCTFSCKQPKMLMDHFADNHLLGFIIFSCPCGVKFSGTERGRAAFKKHVLDRHVRQTVININTITDEQCHSKVPVRDTFC